MTPSYPRKRVSSTPQPLDFTTDALEYWMPPLSRGMTENLEQRHKNNP